MGTQQARSNAEILMMGMVRFGSKAASQPYSAQWLLLGVNSSLSAV
jgi:hypothetical protein